MSVDAGRLFITANRIAPTEGWALEPASPRRDWMDAAPMRAPYRCLPMVMANQSGWVIRSPIHFQVAWDGGVGNEATKVFFHPGEEKYKAFISSHFGSGIITFFPPWLFRTSPGVGLLVRGPTNAPKDGVAALDGVVETDWAPYTFTMNWKITRPNTPITFRRGEVICHLTPYPLELLDRFEARCAPIEADAELAEGFRKFTADRAAGLRKKATDPTVFQNDYLKGRTPEGEAADRHKTNFKIPPFPLGGADAAPST